MVGRCDVWWRWEWRGRRGYGGDGLVWGRGGDMVYYICKVGMLGILFRQTRWGLYGREFDLHKSWIFDIQLSGYRIVIKAMYADIVTACQLAASKPKIAGLRG